MTYEELDTALELPVGQAYRWSKFGEIASPTGNKKGRAPQAGGLQTLENKVAKFLGRPAHLLMVGNNALLDENDLLKPRSIAELASGMNLRDIDCADLEIEYEYDWPTYRRLNQPLMLEIYQWQWKILWDPKVCAAMGDSEVEKIILNMFDERKHLRSKISRNPLALEN